MAGGDSARFIPTASDHTRNLPRVFSAFVPSEGKRIIDARVVVAVGRKHTKIIVLIHNV